MITGTRQRLAKVSKEINVSIENSETSLFQKDLRCNNCDKLSWNEQIDNISKKVSKGIGMLRRAKPFVSTETLIYI